MNIPKCISEDSTEPQPQRERRTGHLYQQNTGKFNRSDIFQYSSIITCTKQKILGKFCRNLVDVVF
jgi:hypothetical protein